MKERSIPWAEDVPAMLLGWLIASLLSAIAYAVAQLPPETWHVTLQQSDMLL